MQARDQVDLIPKNREETVGVRARDRNRKRGKPDGNRKRINTHHHGEGVHERRVSGENPSQTTLNGNRWCAVRASTRYQLINRQFDSAGSGGSIL